MSFPQSGVLSAQQAIAAARAMQGHERDALREAGRKKLDEYRKLKASVMNDIEHKLSSFTASNNLPDPAAAAGQESNANTENGDPMVDVLLAQVSSLMADKQRLAAACSSLQRENEQLVELVGYLSLEQQQLLEQCHLQSTSDEGELEGSWYSEQQQVLSEGAVAVQADDVIVPMHTSCDSVQSMESVYAPFTLAEDARS